MQTHTVTAVLGDLLTMTEACKKSFGAARDLAQRADLKTLFGNYSTESGLAALEFRQLMRLYGNQGGIASSSTSSQLDGTGAGGYDGDKALLDKVARRQEHATTRYSLALREDLPVYVKMVIERQAEGSARNHSLIRNLYEDY